MCITVWNAAHYDEIQQIINVGNTFMFFTYLIHGLNACIYS